MLFLAVFCGFLAEYQLEHKIEKNRERQYIVSLIEDWRADSSWLHEAINDQLPKNIAQADSLIHFLQEKNPGVYASEIYYLATILKRRFFHSFQDRTIVQLRNAGGLRLITNKKVKDIINEYYERVNVLNQFDGYIEENFGRLNDLFPKVFYVGEFQKLFDLVNNKLGLNRPKEKFRLKSADPDILNEFAFCFFNYRGLENQYLKRAETLYNRINSRISLVKAEYHLK